MAEGVDIDMAMQVEDDGLDYDSNEEIEEPGRIDPEDGEFKRPWCPATRILEHRENERIEQYVPMPVIGSWRQKHHTVGSPRWSHMVA